MKVTARFFALVAEKTRIAQVELNLPESAAISDAAAAIALQFPDAADLLKKVAWARNLEYARLADLLQDGDELAVIPAVSGGCAP